MGVETAVALAQGLSDTRFGKDVTENEVREALADQIAELLEPVAKPLSINPANRPEVILVCGVNGTGKTTTIGKLAQQLVNDGKKVMLAAGDTFRAAAIEQLEIWGRRTDCPVSCLRGAGKSQGRRDGRPPDRYRRPAAQQVRIDG